MNDEIHSQIRDTIRTMSRTETALGQVAHDTFLAFADPGSIWDAVAAAVIAAHEARRPSPWRPVSEPPKIRNSVFLGGGSKPVDSADFRHRNPDRTHWMYESDLIAALPLPAPPEPPWRLPDPPPGREWHRDDWTEDMLPEGTRPLLMGESSEPGDVFLWWDGEWVQAAIDDTADENWAHARTSRPLPPPEPTPEEKEKEWAEFELEWRKFSSVRCVDDRERKIAFTFFQAARRTKEGMPIPPLPAPPKSTPDERERAESCGICGGKTVEIRSQFPFGEPRKVCPTCLAERLDMIHKHTSPHYGQPAQTEAARRTKEDAR